MDNLKKLERKADLIEVMNIKENITDLDSIEDFINIIPEKIILTDDKGKETKVKLIKSIKENAFYKKSSGEYFRFKIKEPTQITQEVIDWANKLKNYLDSNLRVFSGEIGSIREEIKAINQDLINIKNSIKNLDKSFQEGLEQVNELTDLKIRKIEKTRGKK